MRRHRIVYSEAARADIVAIRDRIREAGGALVADRFVARIIATVEGLEFMPVRHRIRSELRLAYGLRDIASI
jgi:plasmid stabilization system protein ParE